MGLQLSKTLSSGHVADYWRVNLIRLVKGGGTRCDVDLFKDQASAAAGKIPVEVVNYEWNGDDDPCTVAAMDVASSNAFKLCYEKLKTLPDFAGASDV